MSVSLSNPPTCLPNEGRWPLAEATGGGSPACRDTALVESGAFKPFVRCPGHHSPLRVALMVMMTEITDLRESDDQTKLEKEGWGGTELPVP